MTNPEDTTREQEEREAYRQAQREAREAALQAAPYAVVHVEASGIHPSTSRVVSLTILTLTPEFEVQDSYYQVFNSGADIGPKHLHGVSPEDVEDAPTFEKELRHINSLLSGRILIMHNMPRTWGFLYSESKIAIRAMQKRARGRSRNRRGRRRIGRVARPRLLVDTLASARRSGLPLKDTRVRAVARELGIAAPDPRASTQRAQLPAEQISTETAQLIAKIYREQTALSPDERAEYDPASLKADRFGLQRSITRVEATEVTPKFVNPGQLEAGKPLVQGMEFVISPDIAMDPDPLISRAVEGGLTYAEKVTRQSSLVVCNETSELRGKAMHADRKDIPLIGDKEFATLLDAISPAIALAEEKPAGTPAASVAVAKKTPAKKSASSKGRSQRRRRSSRRSAAADPRN